MLPLNHAKGSATIIRKIEPRKPPSARRRPDRTGAACLVSSADRCSVSSVWACVSCAACCGRSALHLARLALLPVLCSRSGCAVGWGLHRRGIQGAPGGGAGHARDKIFQRKRRFSAFPLHTHPILTKRNVCHCAMFQIFRKIQKDPSPGLICVILDRKKGAL